MSGPAIGGIGCQVSSQNKCDCRILGEVLAEPGMCITFEDVYTGAVRFQNMFAWMRLQNLMVNTTLDSDRV